MDDVEEDKPQARAPGEPTDVDLVRAYREGDVHAFEELHRRYVASIYRLAPRELGHALLAAATAQESLLQALRVMGPAAAPFNFVGRIAPVRHHHSSDSL